jgi:glycosyltransferase involved in cell wall biosynthesis
MSTGMARAISIAVTTPTRFHHFALARELERRGCLAAIHTGLPRRAFPGALAEPSAIWPFPWLQTPLAAAERLRLLPGPAAERLRRLAWIALDRAVARRPPTFDVYVAHSGAGLAAGRAVQARGGVYVCDSGTAHVGAHRRLLRQEHDRLDLPPPTFEPGLVERALAEYDGADAITVPSTFALTSFLGEGVPRTRLSPLPYGVDARTFHRVRPRDAEFRVLFVGALSAQKGLPYLLEGFARARLPNARLVLAGAAAPEARTLLARTPVAGLELTGPLRRHRVVEEMSRASVLVLPSVHDGFGLVIGEAMACGCPVIATTHTGGPELVSDGREGFIVPPGDAEAIADRLGRLAADRALVESMAAAAVARIGGLRGWSAYGDGALALYVALARAKGIEVAPPAVAGAAAPHEAVNAA